MISLRTAGAAICLALVAVAVWGAYKHGRSTMDEEWQNRWAVRDAGDKQAWALAEVAEREKEQALQRSITKAAEDGQRRNDEAFAAGAAVRADRGVRDEADRTARVPQVRPAAIPALQPQARQLPAPSWCLPTCSSALMKERETWQQMLIKAGAGE